MIIHTMEQRTPEWHAIRNGLITGTSMSVVAGEGKTAKSKTAKLTLCKKITAERITGQSSDKFFSNASMERGNDLEDTARRIFIARHGVPVHEVGFCESEQFKGWLGFSPDGLVMDDSGAEIKCPDIHTHLDYLLNGVGTKYKWQIQTALAVSGFKSWYFISYCEHYKNGLDLHVEVIERDEDAIDQITAGVVSMINDVTEMTKLLQKIGG